MRLISSCVPGRSNLGAEGVQRNGGLLGTCVGSYQRGEPTALDADRLALQVQSGAAMPTWSLDQDAKSRDNRGRMGPCVEDYAGEETGRHLGKSGMSGRKASYHSVDAAARRSTERNRQMMNWKMLPLTTTLLALMVVSLIACAPEEPPQLQATPTPYVKRQLEMPIVCASTEVPRRFRTTLRHLV